MIPDIILDNYMNLMLSSPVYLRSNHPRPLRPRLTPGQPLFLYFHGKRKRFRMNTYKSLSKQTTLSAIRMNTYKKPGGRVSSQLGSFWLVRKKARSRRIADFLLGDEALKPLPFVSETYQE